MADTLGILVSSDRHLNHVVFSHTSVAYVFIRGQHELQGIDMGGASRFTRLVIEQLREVLADELGGVSAEGRP